MQTQSNRYSFVSQKYWCHNCSRQFSVMRNTEEFSEVFCQTCNSVCEQVNANESIHSSPWNFRIFDNQNHPTNTQSNPNNARNHEHNPMPGNQQNERPNLRFINFFFPVQEIIFVNRPQNPNSQQNQGQQNQGQQNQGQNQEHQHDNFFMDFLDFPFINPEIHRRMHLMRLFEEISRAQGHENNGVPPADKESIKNLKEVVFEEKDLEKVNGNPCPVCQEEFKAKDTGKELKCKHLFHKDCIEPWLNMHRTCPCCRQEVL